MQIFVDSLRVKTSSRRQPKAETVLGVPIVADDDEDSDIDSAEDEVDDDVVGMEVGADSVITSIYHRT